MDESPTLLVTLSGSDRPGVVSAAFTAFAPFGVEVLDIEQLVLRGRIVLGVLTTLPSNEPAFRRRVESLAGELSMQCEVVRGVGDNRPRQRGRTRVTVLGAPLPARSVAAITGRIADVGANIDRIVRMARYPVTAIELHVSGAEPARLRSLLAAEAARERVDVAVQAAGLHSRGPRLVVVDVDSTLVQGEVIEMLAAEAGCLEEVAAITAAAMHGDLDFAESLRRRVALLRGLPVDAVDAVYDRIVLAPGARTLIRTLKRLGFRFGIVSGGFAQITDRLAAELSVEFSAANQLEVDDGTLTGELVGTVLDRAGKANVLREFARRAGVPMESTVAIGDGANDLDMLAAAGLGIAFNAKPAVRDAADTAVNVPYLDAIAYLLGISREEIEAADAAAGITTPAPPL